VTKLIGVLWMQAVVRTMTMLLAVGMASGADGVRPVAVAVLSSSGVPAYRTAVEGLQNALRAQGVEPPVLFDLASENDPPTVERLRSANPRLVVSVGSGATAVAASLGIPYFSTMLLPEEASPSIESKKPLTSVTLDVAPRSVFTRIRQLFPSRRRIGVIRGLGQLESKAEEIRSEAAALGLTVELVDCAGPKELLQAFQNLRTRADLVWCLPDRALYQPASVQALILESIRHGLPLVGFSEAFVRAGALVGFLPDYRDIGGQTAELVRAYQSGQTLGRTERPRTVRTMVNERVVRALGIQLNGSAGGVEFVK